MKMSDNGLSKSVNESSDIQSSSSNDESSMILDSTNNSIAKNDQSDLPPPERGQNRRLSLTLAETFLSILVAVIFIGQITIWLNSSSKISKNQSQVELMNLLVNQAFQERGQPDPKISICLQSHGEPQLIVYVICDSQRLIAEDEFEIVNDNSEGRLIVRRFYDSKGTNIMALDRYEYSPDNEVVQIRRVIFHHILWAIRCAYIENILEPTGVITQNRFTGSCGSMVEVPSHTTLRIAPPPPIVLFMPYR